MKKIGFLILLIIIVAPAYAQQKEETLFSGHIEHGGFGGPTFKLTSISGETALLAGGRGGWILKLSPEKSIIIGGGGYGLVTDVKATNVFRNNQQLYLSFGYGGLEFEYIYHPLKLMHFGAQALIGGGGVSYRFKNSDNTFETDSFFAFEPGVNAIVNVTKFFRISGGLSYRFISGSNLPGATDSDLSGWAGVLTLKFGKF
jgi:hypothetical protein